MRAWTYTRRGSPLDVLAPVDIPRPETIPPNHVQIKVTHCALNPSSTMLMELLPNLSGHPRVAMEFDFAGVITSTGLSGANPDKTRKELKPGTRVFGATYGTPLQLLQGKVSGTLAEYIVAHEDNVVVTPDDISSEVAAGLAAVGCTAVRFLEYSKVDQGRSILINGASGGVGTFTVQLAKHIVGPEGTVVAICSAANVNLVKSLGADEVVAYDAPEPTHQYLAKAYGGSKKFDSIIDTVGVQSLYTHCPAYLKEGRSFLNAGVLPYTGSGIWGVISFMKDMLANYCWPRLFGGTARKYELLTTDLVPELLEKLRAVVASGAVKGVVDSMWVMEDALKAYERVKSHRARGKVIVQVQKE